MRTRTAWLVGFLILSVGGLATWSLTRGQDQPRPEPARQPTPNPQANLLKGKPATPESLVPQPAATPSDPTKLTPLQQQMQLSARRGADWLFRMNGADGRFVHGYLPALKTPMEGDHYLRQVGAALALARAARFTGEERYAARATQAVLTLLGETVQAGKDSPVRHTQLPSAVINRLGAAGLLVAAINELPAPREDLLEKSEQLCNYLRQQQQADGSFLFVDDPKKPGPKGSGEDPSGVDQYPGLALYGLMLSQRHKPAEWKTDAARKALAYYRPFWAKNRSMAFVPAQTAAFAEAFLLTKEPAFAEFVYEMNDWLCGLQYERLDPRRALWYGGFQSWANGSPAEVAPDVLSAVYSESLADACRLAREQGEVTRYPRYKEALERSLQFLTALQYTDANTQHFADWYRPALVGAFHASHHDGNLRIDYTQHAVCALVQYLTHVAKGN